MTARLLDHVRGASTGADRDRKGIFREAGAGGVLLDEIGEMRPPSPRSPRDGVERTPSLPQVGGIVPIFTVTLAAALQDDGPMNDEAFFPALAAQLTTDLQAAKGNDEAERAALQKMVDAYTAAAKEHQLDTPTGDPMIPERFCEDGYKDGLSVIEYAAKDDEDAEFRWRELLCDLCGY